MAEKFSTRKANRALKAITAVGYRNRVLPKVMRSLRQMMWAKGFLTALQKVRDDPTTVQLVRKELLLEAQERVIKCQQNWDVWQVWLEQEKEA